MMLSGEKIIQNMDDNQNVILENKNKQPIIDELLQSVFIKEWPRIDLILPTGRRPFKRIRGFDYGLDESEIEVDPEDIQNLSDNGSGEKFQRFETYLYDSFVCETGYLSEDELMITPEKDWKTQRSKMIQAKANSAKKKWKMKVKSMQGPEITYAKDGKKRPLKKWNAIVFSQGPVQTGFSVEHNLTKLTKNKTGEFDAISRLENLQLCAEDIEDAMVIARKMMAENCCSPQHHHVSCSANPMEGTKGLDVDLKAIKASHEVPATNKVDESAPSHVNLAVHDELIIEDEDDDVTGEFVEKYKVKYLIKDSVRHLMNRYEESEKPKSPGLLLQALTANIPQLSNSDTQLVNKYVTKYYFKFAARSQE